MMKKGVEKLFLTIFLISILLIIPMASAGLFSDLWGKITGKATDDTTALNITIGNSNPTIDFVFVPSAVDPNIGITTNITINFTAGDVDGLANLDNSTAWVYLQKAGQTNRSNSSCEPRNASGNNATFSCAVTMWYWDVNGAWEINASIQDNSNAYIENSSEVVTYNVRTAMTMSPTTIGWGIVNLTDTNTGSDDDPITVNNSGNDYNLSINVTALDLRGETTDTQYIWAENFTIEDTTEGCTGTVMVNDSSINVTSAILKIGNNTLNYNNATSGQEQIFFCLKGVPQDISAQSYSSASFGAWTVEIVT